MTPLNEIVYTLAIPTWEPTAVTPFQGFAPGLLYAAPLLARVVRCPADILELTMDPDDRLARRRAGQGDWLWSPITIDNLERPGRQPQPALPFMVVMTADPVVAKRVARWRRRLRIRPLHVSLIEGNGAIAPHELTVDRLQRHCQTALRQACEAYPCLDADDAFEALQNWRPWTTRPSSLRFHSHGVTMANEMALISTGELASENEDGVLHVSPHQDYVDAISESAQAVRDLQVSIEDRPVFRFSPPMPDLILCAPAIYANLGRAFARTPMPPIVRRAFRSLQRQTGYTSQIQAEEADMEEIASVKITRGAELKMQMLAVGMAGASALAPTIRFPGAVNRISGVIGQLGRHMRHYDERLPNTKTARVFRAVQDALKAAVPTPHLEFIMGSQTGVKIIADAPLEWLPTGDLPLGIRFDVSRINATPGNTLIEQLRPTPPLYIPPAEFKRYLVVSMFEEDDRISRHMRRALEVLPDHGLSDVQSTVRTASSVDAFVEAINDYDGPILIVDSHGAHVDNVGGLIIGGQAVDIWSLKDRLRPPPIVILSACDTHPFDRTHATIANGFLHCGAQAVLATVLPVRSIPAAIFVVRLLQRAAIYGDLMNNRGQALSWAQVVGGALRMQLASDIVRGLRERALLPKDQAHDLQLSANFDINTPRLDWFDRLAERAQAAGGFDKAIWDKTYADILAASDVIRYCHLGNPETIRLADARAIQRAMEEAGLA